MAVQGALVRCSQSRAPITALADFAEELKGLGWGDDVVEDVERRVLSAMFGEARSSPYAAPGDSRSDRRAK